MQADIRRCPRTLVVNVTSLFHTDGTKSTTTAVDAGGVTAEHMPPLEVEDFLMRHLTTACTLTALLTGAFAQGAAADISAEEAWGALRDMLIGSGYSVSADESRDGATLVVSNLTFTMETEAAPGSTTVDFGTLRFTETGDGAVNVEMPEVMPISSTFQDPSIDGTVSVQVDVTQTGASLIMSGDPDNITQTYTAESVGVTLGEMKTPDPALPADAIRMTMSLTDLASTTTIGSGELRPIDATASAGAVSYDMAFNVPGEGSGGIKGQMSGLTFAGTGKLPSEVPSGDIIAMLDAGYALDGTFGHTGGSMMITGEEEGQTFTAETTSTAGALDFAMNGDNLTYNVSQSGATITAMVPDMPFPIAIEADGIKAGLTLPLDKGDTPQDFSLLVNLQDFEMSDMLWSMFDPASVLPRDPATLLVDLAGKATLFYSFLDPNVAAKIEANGDMPAEINALDIKGLELSLVGASLTGTGDFTFDNSDTATFGGMPKPTGALDLKLVGGNALIDKLSELGFIGPQEAGSARMMMGLLAVPGQEPDTLNSKLEINEQGHILANGQRIQ